MSENNERAYVRGRKVAIIWKSLKKIVSTRDQLCVAWAKNHKLPAWIGHLPIISTVLISLAGLIVGGVAIASMIVFIWALAYILQHIGSSPNSSHDSHESYSASPEVRAGSEGYGLYSGSDELTSYRMDKDYDE